MEDAKNGTTVLDRSGFLAMLSATGLPPGFALKRRYGVRAGAKAALPWGYVPGPAPGDMPSSSFLPALMHPVKRSSWPKRVP